MRTNSSIFILLRRLALPLLTSLLTKIAYSENINPPIIEKNETYFNETIKTVDDIYQPIFREMGVKFHFEKLWESPKDNAYAYKYDPTHWVVYAHGGLFRHKLISREAFIIGLCHEIGHLVGLLDPHESYASEKMSDYYAVHVCARKFLKDESEIIRGMTDLYNWGNSYGDVKGYPSSMCRFEIMLSALGCKKKWNDKIIPLESDVICSIPLCE